MQFDCYSLTNDALLYKPDIYAYYISIGVVAAGLVLSIIIIVLGIIKCRYFARKPSIESK